ncbi:MAG: 3-deoxy-D-manno-octulosonic acid transferase [Candidatus Acidiferrales bacterium]
MVLVSPYFLVRGARQGKYLRNLPERLGRIAPEIRARAASSVGGIWLHAVSVGEVMAAQDLVRELKERFPERAIFLSTTTETGQRVARERITSAAGVFYFPLDWAWAVRRVFRAIQPALIVILETEVWPNFLREARRRKVPVVIANARISDRSLRGYNRVNRYYNNFVAAALDDVTAFLAQTGEDAHRLEELGADPGRIEVTGNMKYDVEPPRDSELSNWLEANAKEQERWPIIVAGSVVQDEEEPVLAAFDQVQRRWRHALLVLAPRKPERFDDAARIAADYGWDVVRRSRITTGDTLPESADVLLLDSIGELASLYRLADAVFIGGSLVPLGGHNILEPAWFSKPPVFGSSMANFREIAARFLAARAGVQVASSKELGEAWVALIQDPKHSERMGQAARELVRQNRGATQRVLERLLPFFEATGSPA